MSRAVANVAIATDIFATWLNSTNILLYSLSTEIITANATYANTTGNAQLFGTFNATNLVATTGLSGGNVTASGLLSIISNAQFTAASVNSTANVNVNAAILTVASNSTVNVVINGSQIAVTNSTNTSVITPTVITTQTFSGGSGTVNVQVSNTQLLARANTTVNAIVNASAIAITNSTSNVNITANSIIAANSTSSITISPAGVISPTDFWGTGTANAFANSTTIVVQANSTVNSTILSTQITVANSTGTTTVSPVSVTTASSRWGTGTANAYANSTGIVVESNSTVNTAITATTVSTNVVNAANINSTATLAANNITVTAIASNLIPSTNNTMYIGNSTIMFAEIYANTVTTTQVNWPPGQILIQNDCALDDVSNTNIGAGSPVIYRFPKATYSAADFTVRAKDPSGANFQLSKILIVTDGASNVAITTYGTIAVGPLSGGVGTPLGSFTANINVANIELVMVQSVANCAVKVVVDLLKV